MKCYLLSQDSRRKQLTFIHPSPITEREQGNLSGSLLQGQIGNLLDKRVHFCHLDIVSDITSTNKSGTRT